MDTDTLVDGKIDDGRKLLDLLNEKGLGVVVACWARASESGRWSFYIALEAVDRMGLAAATREVYSVYGSVPDAWLLLSEVKLIGTDDPIARDALEIQGLRPTRRPIRSRRPRLGNVAIDEVYIYPPPTSEKGGLRQAFTVTYVRQGPSDHWTATIERTGRYEGMNAKGAVAYSAAHWGDEADGPEPFATVSVLLEMDPKFDDENAFIHPGVWQLMSGQAYEMADEMFRSRHPSAVIEHAEISV